MRSIFPYLDNIEIIGAIDFQFSLILCGISDFQKLKMHLKLNLTNTDIGGIIYIQYIFISKGVNLMKITITVNDDLLNAIDEKAEDMFMTRSGFMRFCCQQFINQNKMFTEQLPQMLEMYNDFKKAGFIKNE